MWRRRRKPEDFSAEIEAHLELEREELEEDGMTADEARSTARKRFGNRRRSEEFFYESSPWVWLDHLWGDVRHSLRGLRRSPGFTIAVVLTLSLAIGAGTAIFNVADEALFRPLPLEHPEQLTAVYNYDQKTGAFLDSSYPDYSDYRDHARSFEGLSAYVRLAMGAAAGNHAMRVQAEAVTPEYFAMLRLTPLIGSTFGGETAPEVLLSERLWRKEFGSNPKVVGTTLRLERRPFTIIGIIPEHFRGVNLSWSEPPDLWIPIRAAAIAMPRLGPIFGIRAARWLVIIGRRKAGISVEQAQSELQGLAANIATVESANRSISAVAFEASRSKFWPAHRDKLMLSLGVFGAAAALVLFLACANITNLVLERALARQREIGVQLALGAARSRLIRRQLVESVLLVAPGFLGALPVSVVLARLLGRYPGAIGEMTLSLESTVDPRMLLFGFVLSVAAAALFGVLPALQATRTGAHAVLSASDGKTAGRREQWLREAMVIAQIAFTTVLLIGGGLFARSLLRGYAIDPGFRGDHLIMSNFDFNAVPPATREVFIRSLIEESAALPGIESAAVSPHIPLTSGAGKAEVSTPIATQTANLRYAGAGFFSVMKIPIREGREFGPQDRLANIAIISHDLAARFWKESPIGKRLSLKRGSGPAVEVEIVGVANPIRAASVWLDPEPQVYTPWENSTQTWILRTRNDPESARQQVQRFWSSRIAEVPLWNIRTGDEIVADALAPQALAARLFASFGLLAVTLSAIGLYSLTAYSVVRRTREIGIRIAIGALPGFLVRRILGRGLLLAMLGLVVGIAAALALGGFVSPLVREISPQDPFTLLFVTGSLLCLSTVAILVPALRVARVAPAIALRSE